MSAVDYEPAFLPGDTLTCIAAAAIAAGQLVTITDEMTVAPTTRATSSACGVAADFAAAGQKLTVYFHGVHWLTCATAVSAGAPVVASVIGQVTPYSAGGDASQIIGRALGPGYAGQTVKVRLP